MVRQNRERKEVNLEVRGEEFELLFDPNLLVIVVGSGNRINAKKLASVHHPGANIQECNLARIKFFRTRQSGHRRNLRESNDQNRKVVPKLNHIGNP